MALRRPKIRQTVSGESSRAAMPRLASARYVDTASLVESIVIRNRAVTINELRQRRGQIYRQMDQLTRGLLKSAGTYIPSYQRVIGVPLAIDDWYSMMNVNPYLIDT